MRQQSLKVYELACLGYRQAWQLQEKLQQLCWADRIGATLLLLEHPPVLTLGKHGQLDHLLVDASRLHAEEGVELVRSDRGGQITAHMPGQLVAYPILKLAHFKLGLRQYIFLLEQCIIDLLKVYGLQARRDPAYPGVWLGHDKVCAIGVRIKQRVSMHGIALNVCNSLQLFKHIVPCGIQQRGVTSLAASSGQSVTVQAVASQFAALFAASLELQQSPSGGLSQLQELLGSFGSTLTRPCRTRS